MARPRPRPRSLAAAAALFAGLLLSPILLEAVCWIADEGAFPHVNVYVADEALGARLQPGATERISFSGNPVSSVRINARGYRGPDWGPATADDILLVGDSQAFGLGVDEGDTAAVVVDRRLHRAVLNAAVPTYGPEEYLSTVEAVLAERPVGHVVIVLNASNDFFELGRPNRERHRIWDGWAVRAETAPELVEDFPGRAWLYGRSHAFFAWRRLRHGPLGSGSLPSEGQPADLLPAVSGDPASKEEAERQRSEEELRIIAAARAEAGARAEGRGLVQVWLDTLGYDSEELDFVAAAVSQGAHPGDIIDVGYGEGSRSVALTAQLLEEGAQLRAQVPERARAWLKEHPDSEMAPPLRAALAAADGAPANPASIQRVAPRASAPSPFHDYLLRANALVAEHEAELTVVMLPLDVQVSEAEWVKYGAAPQDLTAANALLDEVARDGRGLGIRMLQPRAALAAAEPGAFLDGDLHLSPKGHRVVGEALADLIRGPAPVPLPGWGLPEGRSRVPLAEEWALPPERHVDGQVPSSCSARRVREWVRLDCDDGVGLGLAQASEEALWSVDREGAHVVLPTTRASIVDVHEATRVLRFRFDGETATMVRLEATPAPRAALPSALLSCEIERGWVGDLEHGCEATGCEGLQACADGSRRALPDCPEGEANAGSSGHCYALCDEAHPCTSGVCTPWQGSAVCL